MKIDFFEWNNKNMEHIVKHGVLPEEAEEIFIGRIFYRKTRENKYLAFGQTVEGRYLLIVFALKRTKTIRVITARDMDKKELSMYKNWIKR